jgi:hypothetical protein
MCGPPIGLWVQAVMHMDRTQALPSRSGIAGQQMQQHHRIQTAAEANE